LGGLLTPTDVDASRSPPSGSVLEPRAGLFVHTLRRVGRPWTEERIRRELEAFLPAHDAWPSYRQFRAAGHRGLWEAIARRDGPVRFADEYGLPCTPSPYAVTDDQVRARLRAALRASDVTEWPSRQWLAARGGRGLLRAVERTGGADRWAAELGLPLRPGRGPWTAASIEQALEPLLVGRRTWPNRRELAAAGRRGLYDAITNMQGHRALASRYGLPLQRPNRQRAGARHSPRRSRSSALRSAPAAATPEVA
jgi:hypothetical protein